jgi:hypothetical protein
MMSELNILDISIIFFSPIICLFFSEGGFLSSEDEGKVGRKKKKDVLW